MTMQDAALLLMAFNIACLFWRVRRLEAKIAKAESARTAVHVCDTSAVDIGKVASQLAERINNERARRGAV
jgi:hypothetical protein